MMLRHGASLIIAAFALSTLPAGADTPAPATPASLASAAQAAAAEGRPVWVFFKDRALTPEVRAHALDHRRAETPARTLQRRLARAPQAGADTPVTDADLPVGGTRLDALRDLGARVRRESRWLNAASVIATPDTIQRITQLPFVTHVQPVARWKRDEVVVTPPDVAPRGGGGFYGASGSQINQLNLTTLHQMGFTGQGVVIGILDTGFKRTHLGFSGNGGPHVIAEYDFINNDSDTSTEAGDAGLQHCHGTYVLGVIGAYNPGTLMGAAYDASFILCKTEDTLGEYQGEEDNFVAGLEFAEFHGADLVTASLGYIDWYTQGDLDGQTAVTTIAFNEATSRGLICLSAAGNEGNDNNPATSTLIAPADALHSITVGAVNRQNVATSFSSDGPTADGRLKPEVLARGVNVQTVTCLSDSAYTGVDGTSFATPLVAGAVACLLQARPAWTVEQVREHLFTTATDYAATGLTDPLSIRGYGVVDAHAAYMLSLCPGDVDGSGTINFTDLELILEHWATPNPTADLNNSGSVDFDDLNEVLDHWGEACQ